MPFRWWHTPGHWSDGERIVPATEFTVAAEVMPEALQIVLEFATLVDTSVSPTLLSESLDATAHAGWTDLLTYGSDRLAHVEWKYPDTLLHAEVAAVWHGLGGSADRRTRGIAEQLRWLGATVVQPTEPRTPPAGIGTVVPQGWTSPEELPLGLVARLAHLQAARICAAAVLAAGAEVDALRSLLTSV